MRMTVPLTGLSTGAATYYIPVPFKCRLLSGYMAANGALANHTTTLSKGTDAVMTFASGTSLTAGTPVAGTLDGTNWGLMFDTSNPIKVAIPDVGDAAVEMVLTLDLDEFARTT